MRVRVYIKKKLNCVRVKIKCNTALSFDFLHLTELKNCSSEFHVHGNGKLTEKLPISWVVRSFGGRLAVFCRNHRCNK